MPYSAEHKERSRKRILESASRLFAQHGYEEVTIDALMGSVGMTRGAFYAHFDNKAAVYAEAIIDAAINSPRARQLLNPEAGIGELKQLASAYLSRGHIDGKNDPCPLGFFVTDVANREPGAREAYTHVYHEFTKRIATQIRHATAKEQEHYAYTITALLIGGVALSRAISASDTVDKLLASCLTSVEQLLVSGDREFPRLARRNARKSVHE